MSKTSLKKATWERVLRSETRDAVDIVAKDEVGFTYLIATVYTPDGDAESKEHVNLVLAAKPLHDAALLALRKLREFYNDKESEEIRVLKAAIAMAEGKAR